MGSRKGTSLLSTTAAAEMPRRIRIPGRESINPTSNPIKLARAMPSPDMTSKIPHSAYLIYLSSLLFALFSFASISFFRLSSTSLGSLLSLAMGGSRSWYSFFVRGIPTKIAT